MSMTVVIMPSATIVSMSEKPSSGLRRARSRVIGSLPCSFHQASKVFAAFCRAEWHEFGTHSGLCGRPEGQILLLTWQTGSGGEPPLVHEAERAKELRIAVLPPP